MTDLGLVRRTLPLSAILATRAAMDEVIVSERLSETPDAPIFVKARQDMPGLWELADGHHRVAAALRQGRLTIEADCDPQPDDEPLSPPFYLFPTGVTIDFDDSGIGDRMVVEVPGDERCDHYEETCAVYAVNVDHVSEYRDVQCPSGRYRLRPGPAGWARAEDIEN